MINLSLTTKEAIALEHYIGLARILLAHGDANTKQKLMKHGISDELLSAHEKLKVELDNLAQAQQRLLQQSEPQTDLTSGEIIALCRQQGVQVSEFLGAPRLTREEAIALYRTGEITEGRLAEALGVDRLEARRIAKANSTGEENHV